MDRVWGDALESADRTVNTHVKTLRAKLHALAPGEDPIHTHRGLGYSLDVAGRCRRACGHARMKIGLRILLGYFVIAALAARLLGHRVVQQEHTSASPAMADTLAAPHTVTPRTPRA